MNSQPVDPHGTGPVPLPASHQGAARLDDPRLLSEPAAFYGELRRLHGPVAPVLLDGDLPAWLVIGHRELQQVTTDPATFTSDTRRWRLREAIPEGSPLHAMFGGANADQLLSNAEGEAHHIRALALHEALAAVDLVEFRARCEGFGDRLIDGFAAGAEAELMSDYALLLPVLALGWAFGVPESEGRALIEAFSGIMRTDDDPRAAEKSALDIVLDLVRRARLRPGPDVAGRLAAHPAGLTDPQIVSDLMLSLIVGQTTTAYWIGNALRLMLTDSRYVDTLTRGRLPVSRALREVLWDDTPTQVLAGRCATRQVTVGRALISAGDLVMLGLAAANTDPHIRPDPEAGLRGSCAYMSYSLGPHGCPAAARDLAEAVATVGIEVLLDRLPDLRLACPPEELRWLPSTMVHGLQALPVRFTPAVAAPGPHGVAWI